MNFGIWLEHALRKKFSYRAISDLSFDLSGSHFKNGRQNATYFIIVHFQLHKMFILVMFGNIYTCFDYLGSDKIMVFVN